MRLMADARARRCWCCRRCFIRVAVHGRWPRGDPLQVNLAIVGIWLEAGRHEVTLRYAPLHFARDCALSALAWLALFGLCGWVVAVRIRARPARLGRQSP